MMSVSMEEATFVTGDGQKLYSKIWKVGQQVHISSMLVGTGM